MSKNLSNEERRRAKFVYDEPAPGIIVTPPDPNEPIPTYLFPDDDAEEADEVPSQSIFSIGTSLHPWASFERLLRDAGIEVVIDVRSSPRSRLSHFNQTSLRERLQAAGRQYLFFGDALGGRPSVGVADYEVMATSPAFLAGVTEVIGFANVRRTVLMCSEHEPLECHRCLLIGREMKRRGMRVANILRDGSVEMQSETEERLLKATRQTEADTHAPRETRLATAYRLQNQRLIRLGTPRAPSSGRHPDAAKSR